MRPVRGGGFLGWEASPGTWEAQLWPGTPGNSSEHLEHLEPGGPACALYPGLEPQLKSPCRPGFACVELAGTEREAGVGLGSDARLRLGWGRRDLHHWPAVCASPEPRGGGGSDLHQRPRRQERRSVLREGHLPVRWRLRTPARPSCHSTGADSRSPSYPRAPPGPPVSVAEGGRGAVLPTGSRASASPTGALSEGTAPRSARLVSLPRPGDRHCS